VYSRDSEAPPLGGHPCRRFGNSDESTATSGCGHGRAAPARDENPRGDPLRIAARSLRPEVWADSQDKPGSWPSTSISDASPSPCPRSSQLARSLPMPPESTRVELFGEPCVPGSSLKPEKKKPAGFLRSGNRSPRRPLAVRERPGLVLPGVAGRRRQRGAASDSRSGAAREEAITPAMRPRVTRYIGKVPPSRFD
jgi:hypothetical protein